ncbi:PaaI family thioesterase [Sulfobacillus harzensis]|uniref:PaaI family thioesterase n=1 Tax=Sulfobacillus harzensis TaxID=2729629 RepID=A0A7Y0L3B7_9FIRM|nr:PaaI family thioesterase [Sulfobacillus harzensis]NMP21114.1 PaaI family thioesterase [Sulfobacillus harzensis]
MAHRFHEENPYWQWMGFQADEVAASKGMARVRVAIRPEFYQHQGFVHGGVLSALIDSAGAWAFILTHGEGLRTINLAVQYLSPVGPGAGELVADGKLVRVGRRIVIVAVDVIATDETPVATGQVIYSRARK